VEKIADSFFYSLEKAIKTYRQFAQQNLARHDLDVTIDQWLVLNTLRDNPDISLASVARAVFKDVASITRIVQLLETKDLVVRHSHATDRRRSTLKLTAKGMAIIRTLAPVIAENRRIALRGMNAADLKRSQQLLDAIVENCRSETDA
jgi:DNA-binding MarR family transcriptional regulator